MTWVLCDVESDGPCPGLYSMIAFGAIIVEPALNRTFYGQCIPISHQYIEGALQVSGFTREQTLQFPDPDFTMRGFSRWLEDSCSTRPMFISDNNGYDFQFINYYFWRYLGKNPFGHSSTNLGSLYKGLVKDTFKNFKHLRDTPHDHHPVNDAKGNAEALLKLKTQLHLRINFD